MTAPRVFDLIMLGTETRDAQLPASASSRTWTAVHVIAEAPITHGIPKPLYYAENKERFAPGRTGSSTSSQR